VVLSVCVNTATCERLFSEWGLIHSARRNRLDPEKVKQLSVVRAKVRAKNRSDLVCSDPAASRVVDPTERHAKDKSSGGQPSEVSVPDGIIDLVRNHLFRLL
jgi:hypothetical protein